MLVRCNHLLRGHSGVRLEIIDTVLKLLRAGLTPIIPLRGSISASGDLMPLSYLVGILEGNPDIKVYWDRPPEAEIVSANKALEIIGISPFILKPKEGLSLINGSAASAAVASLVAHEASQLVLLAQGLTALTCEAMMGNAENYHEFPAKIRPHPGQIEVATNIRRGIIGSRLIETSGTKDCLRQGLIQDRYALRGASQWLGPLVEDLRLAIQQLTTELNSTQDNPVIDSDSGEVYFCSNFQAATVSMAMEKTRGGLQMIGKLLFSYSSELINPDLNKGLPPNLAADDPSLSFTMKGVDINMAAYMSELGFLANSVTSHVQSAEMNNQPINSLALISARYTLQAVEIVSMMSAALLYVTCQAVDLRILHEMFLCDLSSVVHLTFESLHIQPEKSSMIQAKLLHALRGSWKQSVRDDLSVRIKALSTAMAPVFLANAKELNTKDPIAEIGSLQQEISQKAESLFVALRAKSFSGQINAESSLGPAARALYCFVRRDLSVPFHCGIGEHPTCDTEAAADVPARPRKTVGSWISIIYDAVRDGRIRQPLKDNWSSCNGF
jgi:phenylalanine ammonia-lyase